MNNGQGGYQMSKEQSFRDEIKEIIDGIDIIPEAVLENATDQVLSAIDSRLPKEKEDNSFDEDYINGYNEAIADVRKELGL